MNKLVIIGLLFLGFISCDHSTDGDSKINSKPSVIENDSVNETQENSKIYNDYSSKVIPDKTNYENFEVVYLDFHKDWLQRVFVSIDSLSVYDTELVQLIICEIQTQFDITETSNISFFSEKKYADYKTSLFMEDGHPYPIEEYDNWMNYYYLAEYDFETNTYKTYPNCRKDYKRQKTIKIKCK